MLMLMLYYVVYRDIYCDDGMECLVGKSRFSLFLSLAVRIALSLPRGSARHWASVTSVIFTRVCSCVRDCSFLECPCSQYCVCVIHCSCQDPISIRNFISFCSILQVFSRVSIFGDLMFQRTGKF